MITGQDNEVPPLESVPPSPTGSLTQTVKANVEPPVMVTNLPLNDGIEWHKLGIFAWMSLH